VDIWGRIKCALLRGASLDSLNVPLGLLEPGGFVGNSFDNVESEKKPRCGGGGFFRIDLPGLIIGIAEDDGEGEIGDVGTDEAMSNVLCSSLWMLDLAGIEFERCLTSTTFRHEFITLIIIIISFKSNQ